MSQQDRLKLRAKISVQVNHSINKVLPAKAQIKLSDTLKQCYVFLKDFKDGKINPAPPKKGSNT